MALGSLLMPSPPPPKLYHPLDAPGQGPYRECPLALNLGSGVSIPAKLLSHNAAVFSHRRTSWMDLEDFLDGSGGLPGWVCPSTQGPYSFISCDSPSIPELCLLSITMFLASSSWHLIWLLHLDSQTLIGMAPTSLVPLLELTTPPPPTICYAHPWLRWGWNSVSSADQLLKQTLSILMGEPAIY